jgi:hypothetical protein
VQVFWTAANDMPDRHVNILVTALEKALENNDLRAPYNKPLLQ